MLILRMKPLSVAVVEGEGGRESEQYNTEKVVTEITDGHQNSLWWSSVSFFFEDIDEQNHFYGSSSLGRRDPYLGRRPGQCQVGLFRMSGGKLQDFARVG